MAKFTVTELKSLYVKLGGTASDLDGLDTIPEVLDKIEDIAQQLPDNFPAEAAANAGKFIGFDSEGEYAALSVNQFPADFPAEAAANADKLLGFDSEGEYAALPVPTELPTFSTTDDAGKVLTVTAEGLAWVLPT